MTLKQLLDVSIANITIINRRKKLNSESRFICRNYPTVNNMVYLDDEPYYPFLDWNVVQLEVDSMKAIKVWIDKE